jgi:Na+-translocating ferredoxin:NAD+ oxidoreductase subunit B
MNRMSGVLFFIFYLLVVEAGALFAGSGGGAMISEHVNLKKLLLHSFLTLGGFAVVFGIILAFAAKKWFVKKDPRVEKIMEVLANAHCGACGYAGCEQYAEAVLDDPVVQPDLCTPAGSEASRIIAEITGKEMTSKEPHVARVMCVGGKKEAKKAFEYRGVKDCRAAVLAVGGDKACTFGCLGYGTCVSVCTFGALTMDENDLPVVDDSKCTACRKCEMICPKKVIRVIRASAEFYVACHSQDKPAATRKKCTAGCMACGLCVKVCPTGATRMQNNLVHIDIELCNLCGKCVEKCPTKTIVRKLPKRKVVAA